MQVPLSYPSTERYGEPVDWIDQLEELAEVSERAAEAATSLDAAVEHCPEWSVGDLVSHLADVQWFWAEGAEKRITDGELVQRPTGVPEGVDPVVYLRTQSERLVAALAADDLHAATPLWTWFEPEQHAGFVLRRQLLEATVHAWDIENACSEAFDIELDVAILGLEEFVEVMATNLWPNSQPSVALSLEPDDSEWTRTIFGEASPIVRLQAPASDLLLLLWGRNEVGDERVAQSLAGINMS